MVDPAIPVEIEYKLVVTENASAIFNELSQLSSLEKCALGAVEQRMIHDYYFDTTDKQLGKVGIALRLREQNGQWLLAIKANEKVSDNGLTRRSEWERPWQQDAFADLFAELSVMGVAIAPIAFTKLAAVTQMQHAGFVVIQDRETVRMARTVACPGAQHDMELALDDTRYKVDRNPVERVNHYEIELEMQAVDTDGAKAVVDALYNRYRNLIPWQHNKLVTGLALQRFPGLSEFSQKHSLDRKAYERLHAFIEAPA